MVAVQVGLDTFSGVHAVRIIGFCVFVLFCLVLAGCEGGPDVSPTYSQGLSESREPRTTSRTPVAPVPKKPPSSLTEQADQLYLAGKYQKAYDLYRKAIIARSSDLDAHDGLSRCEAVLRTHTPDGQFPGCQFYENRLKSHPTDGYLLYGAARMYLTSGDRQLASATAYRSLRYRKDLPRSYYLIALMQLSDSVPRIKSASRAFTQALERDPQYGPAYYQLARLEAGFHRHPSKAKDLCQKALKYLRPVEEDIRCETQILLGALYSAEGNNVSALEVFRQALDEHGVEVYQRADIGLLLSRMGRTDEARREWKKVIDAFGLADPTGIKAYRQLHGIQPGSVDLSAFLPRSATKGDYRDLVFNLAQKVTVRRVAVPIEIKAALEEYRTPVLYRTVDLDGNGTKEAIVVEVRPTQEIGEGWTGRHLPRVKKPWRLASPTLYVFTDRAGIIGEYHSRMDHFHQVDVVDFDGDCVSEIVLTEFGGGNLLNVIVLVKRERRYLPALVCPVECSDDSCGVLIADLDGDGRRELMTVGSDPPWTDVYRYTTDGTFAECQKDFPKFYRDYVDRHQNLPQKVLESYPQMTVRLARARAFLAAGREAKPVKTSQDTEP